MGINKKFVEMAERLLPDLHESVIQPQTVVEVVASEEAFQGWSVQPVGSVTDLRKTPLLHSSLSSFPTFQGRDCIHLSANSLPFIGGELAER